MKKATPILATCAVLLSLSPAAQPKEEPKTPPQGNCHNSCTVTVIVPAGCGSGIRVAPDPITVTRGNTTTITWNIVPASPTGWKFDPVKGIVIQGIQDYTYAKGRFVKGPPARVSDHSFRVEHTNTGAAAFKYDINLIGPDSRPCLLDPTILDW